MKILALFIMEKLWSQILVLCSMKMELCTQILALPIMGKLWSQILVLYTQYWVRTGVKSLFEGMKSSYFKPKFAIRFTQRR